METPAEMDELKLIRARIEAATQTPSDIIRAVELMLRIGGH